MQDLRLDLGFADHPKTQKLCLKLGADGLLCLLRLWAFCASKRQKGKLIGMSSSDVEMAARWTGPPGAFADTLLDLGWLDVGDDNCLELHDWRHYQGFIYFHQERSEQAKKAAHAKWHPKKMKKPLGTCCFSDCENPGSRMIGTRFYCDNPSHQPVKGYE